jgi:lambda family phage minor tail protein L
MTIASEIQSLSPSAIIELFVIDMTSISPGEILYFHSGINQVNQPIVWQGVTYVPMPVEVEGFEVTTKGSMPRPKLRVANSDGLFSSEIRDKDDLIGCKLTRKRTFARYLDAVNFSAGNPEADPDQYIEDDTWVIDQKITENRYVIEWEMASALDIAGVMLPARQMIQNTCTWKYRGEGCGYTGTTYFDELDQPVGTAGLDKCGKRVRSCRLRFGVAVTPFGGFPGLKRYG